LEGDTTFYPSSAVAPGGTIKRNYVMMPNLLCPKNWRGKEGAFFYSGVPAKPMSGYKGAFSLLDPDAKNLYEKQNYISGNDIDKFLKKNDK
jgi:hypothetical protein